MDAQQRYDIDTLLDEVVTLPSMPASLARITELINNPDSSLHDVGRAISADPSISIKTLRLVNSVYYGLDQKVSTVEHAVVLLGTKVVKNMVLSATVFDTMKAMDAMFTRHCVACGMAMRVLAGSGHLSAFFDAPDEAFIYGLLHDIGKVILHDFLPDECVAVAALTLERSIPWYQAEREVIGTDHAELGARLGLKWKLAPEVNQAIRGHHDLNGADEEHRCLAANLCAANYIAAAAGFPSHQDATTEAPGEIWEAAGLDAKMLVGVMDRFFASVPDIGELLAINE